VRGNRNDARPRAHELRKVIGVTAGDVFSRKFSQEGCLHEPDARRHVPGRTVGVALDFAPLGVLLIDRSFHGLRHGGQRHLDEVPGVIDRFRERCRQNNQPAAIDGTIDYHRTPTILSSSHRRWHLSSVANRFVGL
jgi:hypothetical protein